MNLYTVNCHNGVWLCGYSIVIAETLEQARELMDVELLARGLKSLSESASKYSGPVIECVGQMADGTKPQVIMLFDGDY